MYTHYITPWTPSTQPLPTPDSWFLIPDSWFMIHDSWFRFEDDRSLPQESLRFEILRETSHRQYRSPSRVAAEKNRTADTNKDKMAAEKSTSPLDSSDTPLKNQVCRDMAISLYLYFSISVVWCIRKPLSSYLLPPHHTVAVASHIAIILTSALQPLYPLSPPRR